MTKEIIIYTALGIAVSVVAFNAIKLEWEVRREKKKLFDMIKPKRK